jgi:hypothetical protein
MTGLPQRPNPPISHPFLSLHHLQRRVQFPPPPPIPLEPVRLLFFEHNTGNLVVGGSSIHPEMMGPIGNWIKEIDWPLLISSSKALLTPAIAIITTYIAVQQWKTNRNKLKLDLYDRRFKVFERIRDILAMMFTVVSDDKRLFELLGGTREAEFLFGAEIKGYIEEVYRRASALSSARNQLREILGTAPTETRIRLADIESEHVKGALEESRAAADKFKRYLT